MSTFYQRFQESARKFPDNIALEIQRQETVERVTFAELTRMSESVANWLATRVPRDARVAILAGNHPRWVAAYLGIIAAGRTAVPLDTAFHADQARKLLIDSGASLLFCDVKHFPVAREAVDGLNLGLVMISAATEQNLAQNLGQRALENGKSVCFSTVNAALADLLKQESLPAVERRMKRYTTPDILILDELGYLPCDARSGDLLYSIVSRRHERASTIITTNLAFKAWGTVFPGAACVGALVDRFTQHCHALDIEGDSWRQRPEPDPGSPQAPAQKKTKQQAA